MILLSNDILTRDARPRWHGELLACWRRLGQQIPPLLSARNSLSQTLPRPSCPCTTLLPEVELTISRNLPCMTHVLTPNPEIGDFYKMDSP